MRSIFAIVVATVASEGIVAGQETALKRADVSATIERGLGFLVKDALAWKAEHNCVSCHHAALVVWAMREAKQHRHAVDEPVLAELTKWMAESGDGKTGVPRPEGRPKALNTKAVYFALALQADVAPDPIAQEGLKRFVKTVQEDQAEDGSWSAWPETRPPIFGPSDDSMTSLATLALVFPTAAGDETAIAARDRGLQWLLKTKTDDDPQSVALRLVVWRRLDRPTSEWEPLMLRIRERQNSDGGWSQAPEMASDAWATGQALYALAHAGLALDEPVIARGRTFLIKTQRPDGSWPMTSRPITPGGEGSKSLIPVTGAGSAWAILGLVETAGRASPARP